MLVHLHHRCRQARWSEGDGTPHLSEEQRWLECAALQHMQMMSHVAPLCGPGH